MNKNTMNKETILVIGAAGNNGTATIQSLEEKSLSNTVVRAAVRTDVQAKALKAQFPNIETVLIDLEKAETLTGAMQGVDKVFMIPGNVENREEHAKNAIDAAVAAGSIKQFVFYSVVGAEYEAILFARQFRAGEKYLEQSGLNYTHLRTIFFQDNFFGWADGIKQGGLYVGLREGRFAPLNIADIGEMAANILTTSGHDNKAYNVTGPELLGGEDMAKVFAEVTGKKVAYVSPTEEQTLESLLSTGWPEWQSHGMIELFEVFASNQAAVVSPDGEQLLGRPMTTLEEFVSANKQAFV
ncbi:SDR family oxidoreductase [Vibrio superstes]|uniref:Nucleotide-diphosphate-sugar epimerase n=1 Tax=Vibrio superstes NBRC 103154 TaxID=1219062 RepID=A0A511QP21_9VIBR|nr:SDR family oxidoreductase [Vibrio superstes]GEM79075.1 nucleotide-diphosphate-sugar epimerase [Vibrio superstes NBRC 103154]